MAAAATARRAAVPARVPSRRAPARAPSRRAPARRPGGQLIPLAAGAATAVRQLPDSSLMVRMTGGRVWIGVLGVLLAGIVAVNVVTLSIAASAGHVDQKRIRAGTDQRLRGAGAQFGGGRRNRGQVSIAHGSLEANQQAVGENLLAARGERRLERSVTDSLSATHEADWRISTWVRVLST